MNPKLVALLLGALTGAVGLISMARLVAGAFDGSVGAFGWAFVLLAMIPWVAYVAWRAHHGRLSASRRWAVLALGVAGMVAVWLSTIGPVIALACSLAAFVIIWVSDWPARRSTADSQLVHIEDLSADSRD